MVLLKHINLNYHFVLYLQRIKSIALVLYRSYLNSLLQLLLSQAQGDKIGQIFNIWLLFTWVIWNFYLIKQFQNTVCCTYFNIQKQFDAYFQLSLWAFVIWLQFGLHFQKLGNFFQTSCHSGQAVHFSNSLKNVKAPVTDNIFFQKSNIFTNYM